MACLRARLFIVEVLCASTRRASPSNRALELTRCARRSTRSLDVAPHTWRVLLCNHGRLFDRVFKARNVCTAHLTGPCRALYPCGPQVHSSSGSLRSTRLRRGAAHRTPARPSRWSSLFETTTAPPLRLQQAGRNARARSQCLRRGPSSELLAVLASRSQCRVVEAAPSNPALQRTRYARR